MKSKEGHTVSIGPLAVADTRLTATVLPIPVWGTFIAWASFFILGDRKMGLLQSIASIGAVVSSLTLLAISSNSSLPIAGGSALMVQALNVPLLSILPAIVWDFASMSRPPAPRASRSRPWASTTPRSSRRPR